MYLPVAVLRTRDMGASWWSSVVIIVVGATFFIFLFLWIGIAKSTPGIQQWNLNKPFPIIAVIIVAILAVIVVLSITTAPQPSGANQPNPPDPPDLTVCDTWLREQLDSPEVTSVQNANAAITDIQANRPNQCAPSAWNPVVDNVAKDYVGNIDVKFWITNTEPARHSSDYANRWHAALGLSSRKRAVVLSETGRPVSPSHTAHLLQPVGPELDNGATQHFTPHTNGPHVSTHEDNRR